MKKLIILSLFMLALVSTMFALDADPRTVYQEIAFSEVPPWTITTYPTTDPHYLFRATYAGITFGTDSSMPQVSYFNVSYVEELGLMVAQFDQAAWPVANTWVAGQTITMNIWYRSNTAVPFDTASNPTSQYIMTVPAGFDPIFNLPSFDLGTDVWTIPAGPNGPANTWRYNLQLNGPAGTTVTGPGTYAGTLPQLFTTGQLLADSNDLIGTWTAGAAPAGMQWVENPITVQASDFAGAKVDHVYGAEKTFVAIPIPDTYTLNVNAVGPASLIYKNTVSTGETTNHSFSGATAAELTGIYTLEPLPAGWHWEPASITVEASHFTSSKSGLQVWGTMSNGAKVAYSHTITFTQMIDPTTFTLNVNGPDGYAVTGPVAGTTDYVATDSNDLVNDLVGSYEIAAAPAGYHWAVNPIVVAESDFVANAFAIEFVLVLDPPVIVPIDPSTIPAGAPTTNVVNAAYTVNYVAGGVHDVFIPRTPTDTGALAYIGGDWLAPDGAPDWTWLNVNFGAKAPITIIVLGPTLPVELSSFTGTMTAEYFVQLNWTSQSETSLLGYRVLRGETADVNSAVSITPTLVTATNTSTTQNYSITDTEVENNTTYSYWLESVNMDGTSEFHGPVNVLVQHEVPPVLPEYTSMRNAYPNPFAQNSSTNLEVSVKAGETGTVTIYNILGQVVKTYTVREGLNNLNWNGKDSKGNTCGSGIYFYRLSTPSMNQTKKMVIVK